MKKIITISRQFGSAGGTIGHKVADALGFEYYDKELIIQAARESNIDIETFLSNADRVPLFGGFTESLFSMYSEPLNEKVFQAQKKVIRKIAEKGRCVIVGRSSNSILKEFDDSLHVFIHANESWRLKYLKNEKMKDFSENKILSEMHNVDKRRAKYSQYYTNTEFGYAPNYDLTLCTSTIGIEEAVKLITEIARA